MSFSTHFIKRPVATSLLMGAILAVGAAAYPFLPIASVPQIDFPTIQVNANLPGASPETMAASVAQPLERQFSQIPGVDQMTSSSSLGKTQVTLQFDLDRNIDGAAQDVQSAIAAVQRRLPRDMPTPPSLRKSNPAEDSVLLREGLQRLLTDSGFDVVDACGEAESFGRIFVPAGAGGSAASVKESFNGLAYFEERGVLWEWLQYGGCEGRAHAGFLLG